jgi:DNA transposition AAA+ family ATPase
MQNEQKSKVSEAVNAWIIEGNPDRSQNKLCELSGVSPVMVKAIRLGELTYKAKKDSDKDIAIADQHYYKLAEAVGLKFEREIHFANKNYETVHNICRYAQSKHRRGIIDSEDSGAGKTYSLEAYARQNKKAIYIKATSMMKGRDLIQKIMTQLNITADGKRAVRHLEQITEKFIQPGALIIIDELEGASPDMWRVIKDIEDATYRKIGLIICGKGLINEIKVAAGKGKKLMPQIWRRFKNNQILLKALNRNNVAAACKEHGIEDAGVIKLLSRHIEDWSQLNEYIKDIHDILISKGQEVSETVIKQLFELEEYASH